jgi:pimeloyl-ACP methyl ester carboxylesterase
MSRTVGRVWLALAFAALAVLPVVVPAAASSGVTSALVGTPVRTVYLRAPRSAATSGRPVQVLLALPGMGGRGEEFAKDLIEQADQYGWLIVAPTIDYGDWTNPSVVAREDPLLIGALADYLDQLPDLVGMPTRREVLILGHSRGAQLAHRFAEFRPDKVLAVAALSAGTYTLPHATGQSFPFGLKDFIQYTGHTFDLHRFTGIPFWVGVGGQDTNAAELPRQWDSIEGTTRVQRAQAFEAAMQKLGANSILRVFGSAGHGITSEMRLAACTFLGSAMLPRTPRGTPLSLDPISY